MKKNRHLFELGIALANARFKLSNEGSYLGILWYLLNPLLLFLLLLAIFSQRFGGDIPRYPLYLLLGIIMFNLFQKCTMEATRALREGRNIIKSINFPREAIIVSIVLKGIYSHFFEIIVFTVFLVFYGESFSGLVFYLLILIPFAVFIYGIALFLSSLTIHFADLENIWNFFARLLWFATPIFHSISRESGLFVINLLNPMFYHIELGREVLVYARTPETWIILGAVGYSLLALALGLVSFGLLRKKIAESI